jgi:uncharacterized protein YyaL (SSP411 family)
MVITDVGQSTKSSTQHERLGPMTSPADSASAPTPKTNRLAGETSPYLLQHAANPVDWYPWGPEAIARARSENKPIFLSIGYSACHWCHVMEHESFENPEIAAVMNQHFVNIKVDREERPDLDQIYMSAVMAMTGHGGWPMSVFLTPELRPFFGGTYFPPADSRGMAGFPRVLLSVHRAWEERRDEITESAAEMTEQLGDLAKLARGTGTLDVALLDRAARAAMRNFDPLHGGFGHAPKFPHPMDLKMLMRQHARTGDAQALEVVRHTLEKMSRGGICDHLGGGFARYSTDDRWLVPHFEKMLYDNALLSSAYLEAYQLTRNASFQRVACETMDYVLGRMTDPQGAFYSTEDADSEGVEGKYYVWSLAEVTAALGPDRAKTFCYVYDVTEQGNWEDHNILNLPRTITQASKLVARDEDELRDELAASRALLLSLRAERVPPAKDTKVLVSWNGLMIAALADGGRITRDERYVGAASRAAGFILDRMRRDDGRLLHTYKDGQAKLDAYLDDYADLIDGLTRLYEASGEPQWVSSALELARIMIDEFADAEQGGFYFTGRRHEALITRQKDVHDNATPSGNGMAATALLRLGALTGRDDLTQAGRSALEVVQSVLEAQPAAGGQSLIALDFLLGSVREFAVIAGPDAAEKRAVLEAIATQFLPHKVVAPATPAQAALLAEKVPLLANRPPRENRTTTYVCEHLTCRAPVIGVAGIEAALAAESPKNSP